MDLQDAGCCSCGAVESEAVRDSVVAAFLSTPRGREHFRKAFEAAAAEAADHFEPGSVGETLARMLARLPV